MKSLIFILLFSTLSLPAMADIEKQADKSFVKSLASTIVGAVKLPFRVATWRIKYEGEDYSCKFRPRVIRNATGFILLNSYSLRGKCKLEQSNASFRVSALVKRSRKSNKLELKKFKIKFKDIETDLGFEGDIPHAEDIRRAIRKGIAKLSSKYEAIGCQIKTHKLRNLTLGRLDKKFKFSGSCEIEGQKLKVSTLIKISNKKLSMSNIKLKYNSSVSADSL